MIKSSGRPLSHRYSVIFQTLYNTERARARAVSHNTEKLWRNSALCSNKLPAVRAKNDKVARIADALCQLLTSDFIHLIHVTM